MSIEINYFDEKFCIKDADFSRVQPFGHADVIVNCNQPLSSTGGIIERKVEQFLSNVVLQFGVKAKWDKSSEWYQLRQREGINPPHISKLRMGINFEV